MLLRLCLTVYQISDASSDNFTADQCRIKWLGSQHPDFNHSEWKATETNKLFEILRAAQSEQGGGVDWVDVTKQLGVSQCAPDFVMVLTLCRQSGLLLTLWLAASLDNGTSGTVNPMNGSSTRWRNTV